MSSIPPLSALIVTNRRTWDSQARVILANFFDPVGLLA
jgi:hypothetical protein